MHETRTATVGMNGDGIVTVRVRPGERQSLADAEQNLAAALEARGGVRRPVLVNISQAVPLDADVRRYYSGPVLQGFTAIALVIHASPLGRMIGNVYLHIADTVIPTRLFTSEESAIQWLRS